MSMPNSWEKRTNPNVILNTTEIGSTANVFVWYGQGRLMVKTSLLSSFVCVITKTIVIYIRFIMMKPAYTPLRKLFNFFLRVLSSLMLGFKYKGIILFQNAFSSSSTSSAFLRSSSLVTLELLELFATMIDAYFYALNKFKIMRAVYKICLSTSP